MVAFLPTARYAVDMTEKYEWLSAVDLINEYPSLDDAYACGWKFEGGAFRRKLLNDGSEIKWLTEQPNLSKEEIS